jgi:hypothetical protein
MCVSSPREAAAGIQINEGLDESSSAAATLCVFAQHLKCLLWRKRVTIRSSRGECIEHVDNLDDLRKKRHVVAGEASG